MRRLATLLELRLGRVGVVALGLLVACAGFWATGVRQADRAAAGLRSELAGLPASARQAARGGPTRPDDRLAAFYGNFGTREEAFAALQAIYAAAEQEGLELESGEYRVSREPGARLLRYQIVFPVKGSYPKIRRFVARALNEAPGVALDDLALRRDTAQSSALEARVQFTLFLGGAS